MKNRSNFEGKQWLQLDAAAFEKRIEASMSLDEDWLTVHYDAIADFIAEMDESLINDEELEVLYFLMSRVVAASLPEDVVPPVLTTDELWEESSVTLAAVQQWSEEGTSFEKIPEKLCENSVQPEAIEFALKMLMEFTTVDPSAKRHGSKNSKEPTVRADSIIPIVTQIEAVMRRLKMHFQ